MENLIDIDRVLKKSRLLDSTFFTAPQSKMVSLKNFAGFAQDWFLVTKEFGLGIHALPHHIAQAISQGGLDKQYIEYLENLLQEVALIASDDTGLFRGASNGNRGRIHYQMFFDMVENIINHNKEHISSKETQKLVSWLKICFSSIETGIAILTVIEQHALKIVQSMKIIMEANPDIQGKVSVGNWEYIELHCNIEGLHAQETTDLINTRANLLPNRDRDLRANLEVAAELFADFWKAQSKALFEE